MCSGLAFWAKSLGAVRYVVGRQQWLCMSIYEQRDGMALTSFSFSAFDGVGSWVGRCGRGSDSEYILYLYILALQRIHIQFPIEALH